MNVDRLKLVVVGGGFMGRKHTEFIASNSASVLAGVVDPWSNSLAQELDVPNYSDLDSLFSKVKPDGIIIVNPTDQHLETTLQCLEAGIPVLLEKPVTPTFGEAVELMRVVESGKTPVLVGHHRRHNASAIRAKAMIESGELGRLVAVNGTWANKKGHDYFDVEWHRSLGGGVMLINLIHDLDLLRFFCGDIVSIMAKSSNAIRGHVVEETSVTIFEFANGALGAFLATDASPSPWTWDQATEDFENFPYSPGAMSYQILGTEGSLSIPDLAHYSYPNRKEGNWFEPLNRTFLQKSNTNTYDRQLQHFLDVIRGAAPSVTVRDAATSLALIEAAKIASTERREILLAEFFADFGF
ncbi:MAG: Gfo/Idh/MocA family oxidoreductase [Microbacteriaceae bacterium]